ncbi:24768_t:CDS:2, partial [Gigaspora margarita]
VKQKKTESDATKPIKEITEVKLQMILKSRPQNRQAHIRETSESDGMKPTKKPTMKPTKNDSITPMKTSTTRNDYSKKKKSWLVKHKMHYELVSQTRNALEQKAITPRSPPKSTANSITPTKTDSSNNDTNNNETKSTTRNDDSKKKKSWLVKHEMQ